LLPCAFCRASGRNAGINAISYDIKKPPFGGFYFLSWYKAKRNNSFPIWLHNLPAENTQLAERQVSWLEFILTLPLPKLIQWYFAGFVILTVAGAAADFHRIPYYPDICTGTSLLILSYPKYSSYDK